MGTDAYSKLNQDVHAARNLHDAAHLFLRRDFLAASAALAAAGLAPFPARAQGAQPAWAP